MKNRSEFKDYGKGVLSFGKHKGKTIRQIIDNEEDYGYIVWLNDNVKRITISLSDYSFCKKMVDDNQFMHDAVTDGLCGNYGLHS